jgi:hypothetical protein
VTAERASPPISADHHFEQHLVAATLAFIPAARYESMPERAEHLAGEMDVAGAGMAN